MDTYRSERRTAKYFNIVLPTIIFACSLLMLTACSDASSNTLAPSTSLPNSTPTTTGFAVNVQAQDTIVKLSWSAVANATGYLIYRDGSQLPLTLAAITDTTFTDIGLTNGRTYSYIVAAVDPRGKSILRSPEVKATPKLK